MRLHIAVRRYLLHSVGAMAEGSRHIDRFGDSKLDVCRIGLESLLNALGGIISLKKGSNAQR